jgi:hypothetical protein
LGISFCSSIQPPTFNRVLTTKLKEKHGCREVTPAENEAVLILVTDTPDEETEKKLQEKLKALTSLESLGMTFGHTDQ